MKNRLVISIAAILMFWQNTTFSNDLYNSLTESIDQANAQAHVTLENGIFQTEAGASTMIWYLTGGNRATIGFKYANRTLQSGTISFFSPLRVQIRSEKLCSDFTIKKLAFDVGGALDPDNSSFIITPASPSTCRHAKSALDLEGHLSIANDSGRFFHGRLFGSSDTFKRCKDQNCKVTMPGQPISKVTFFSKQLPNPLDAVAVSIRRNATLRLPNSGGWIQVGDGTGAKISILEYDVVNDRGNAFIKELTINARSGSINTGDNVINLEDGSKVTFSSIQVDRNQGKTTIDDGDISGALGSQSTLLLASDAGKKSVVLFDRGEIELKHISASYSTVAQSLTAQYGLIKGDVRDALIYFSQRNYLHLVSTKFQVELKCPSGTSNCNAVVWGADNSVRAMGTITPFTSQVVDGMWAIDSQNVVRIKDGMVSAPVLTLDTSAAHFPIYGKFDKFALELEAQDVAPTPAFKIKTADVKLASQDLRLEPDEAYPTGFMALDGSVSMTSLGNLGSFALADAALHLQLQRNPSDSLRVTDGSILAHASVQDSAGNSGDASVSLNELKAYQGKLSSKFTLSLNQIATPLTLPPGESNASQGGDLAKVSADIHLREVKINANLGKPFVVKDANLKVDNGVVELSQVSDIPADINLAIGAQELIYIQVNGKTAAGGGVNLCNPKVNLTGGTYRVSAKADLSVVAGSPKFSVRDFVLLDEIGLSADDRNCKYVAGLICGALGGLAGPGFGAAAAYLCTQQVDEARKSASGKINDAVKDTISGYKYMLGQ